MPPDEELRYPSPPPIDSTTTTDDEAGWVWAQIKAEARRDAESEPALASYLYSTILSHSSLERSLAFHLGNKLCSSTLLSTLLYDLFLDTFASDPSLCVAAVADLRAARVRDPACISFSHCLLNFKGFLACQAHRIAHKLWNQSRRPLALALHSRISDVFAVDIHPAAKIGKGILLDHATGVVIGETAVVGNNVSILHHVTLGGTGKASGDRHPKIGDGVLIGAGAIILGDVKIGKGAKIGAGSVVLIDVPPRTTTVGNPARLIGGKEKPTKHEECPGESMDHTSFISDWSSDTGHPRSSKSPEKVMDYEGSPPIRTLKTDCEHSVVDLNKLSLPAHSYLFGSDYVSVDSLGKVLILYVPSLPSEEHILRVKVLALRDCLIVIELI